MKNNSKSRGKKPLRQQPKKDNGSKRINYDNTRKGKFIKDVEQDIEKGKEQPGSNDIAYYTKNPRLLNQAANFSVASIIGDNISGTNTYASVPGIMTFQWTPAYGPDSVAITQCADSMFSFIVHANSRNGSYDAPDLMIGVMAGSEVFNIIGAMIRAYGTAKYYAEWNRYMPDNLLIAQGFDPSELKKDLGKVVFDINLLISQTRQIWVPNTLPILDKHFKMNSFVYKDAPTSRSQIYLFQQGLWKAFSATEIETGSALLPIRKMDDGEFSLKQGEIWAPSPEHPAPWSEWVKAAQFMIKQLISMQDRGIMYGDILKAYGESNIKALPEIDINYVVQPEYNAEIQMIIENISTYGQKVNALFQMNNQVIPSWDQSVLKELSVDQYVGYDDEYLLNFHTEDVPPANIVLATRLIAGSPLERPNVHYLEMTEPTTGQGPVTYETKVGPGIAPLVACTEVVNTIFMCRYVEEPYATDNRAYHMRINQFVDTSDAISSEKYPWYMHLMAFDWHPFVVSCTLTSIELSNTTQNRIYDRFGDYDNFTRISYSTLRNIHYACLYSLLDIPII